MTGKSCMWNEKEEPYIKKWVDYSNRYGVGYLLTNTAVGVYFNDYSKMILDPNGNNFEYFERTLDKKELRYNHSLKSYPEQLKKKVTLLMHFSSFLTGKKDVENYPKKPLMFPKVLDEPTYVRKMLKTKHAVLFRLSNKVVQVIFEDQSELTMSSVSKKVSY